MPLPHNTLSQSDASFPCYALTDVESIALINTLPSVGSATYWKLIDRFSSARQVLSAQRKDLEPLLSSEAVRHIMSLQADPDGYPLVRQVRQGLADIEARGLHVLFEGHSLYPTLLCEIHRPPPLLYVWGDPTVLSLPQLAIVGSRHPTAGGEKNAFVFARELASNGFVVTSGLALGVDVAAHRGALAAAEGKTIAVMGTGINRVYPQRHVSVAQEIVERGGAVISELPPETGAHASNFPQRNRIVSGLSAGVLVVEAAVKSGSLISARCALQQNREVFAVPGSIHNPLSRGCHSLIKEGAKLVECAQDIVDELAGFVGYKHSEAAPKSTEETGPVMPGLFDDTPQQTKGEGPCRLAEEIYADCNEEETSILDALGYDEYSLDELSEMTGLEVSTLLSSLMSLELKGVIVNNGAGYSRVTT